MLKQVQHDNFGEFSPLYSKTFDKKISPTSGLIFSLMAGTTRLVYRIIDGSTVCIRLILLAQNNYSLQRFHRDEFRSLYLLFTLQEKVCSFVRRTDCCFRKLFIVLICRSLHSCQNPQLAGGYLGHLNCN